MKFLKKVSLLCLVALLALSCAACGGFSFRNSDLTPYVSFGDADWRDIRITVKEVAPVTDNDVTKEFNSYFSDSKAYCAIEDATRPIANGDTIFLHYVGILGSALDKALADGKITDRNCAGLDIQEIRALGIGFEGGTTTKLTSLKIGSGSYIDGFESGLVGLVPSEHGNDNPYALTLSFPANYNNKDLAGQSVVFFCAISYIADVSAGDKSPTWTADNITVELVNDILGLSGEDAYPTLDECMKRIREGLEGERESAIRSAKQAALWEALIDKATITLTDEISEAYINDYLNDRLSDMQYLYENNMTYYYYYFGTTAAPTMTALIQYLGYAPDNYMTSMKSDAEQAIKQELVFWYLVRTEGITLTDEEIAKKKAEYIEDYGESVFDGYSEDDIYEQLLFDGFTTDLLKYLEENDRITVKPLA